MDKLRRSVFGLFLRILIATIFLLGLLPVPAMAQTNGTIAGTVTDNTTGSPISGTLMLIFESSAQQPSWTVNTDGSGAYDISIPEGAGYKVAARKVGYVTQRRLDQNVTANATTPVNFSLVPGGIIEGKVTANATGDFIAGADVFAFKPETPEVTFTSLPTDAEGSYSLTAPPDTGYVVSAQKEGFVSANMTGVTAALGPATIVNISLQSPPPPPPASDNTSPAAITNLTVINPAPDSLTLTWTAPGDDGDTGQAAAYDIRHAGAAIDDETKWNAAMPVNGEPGPHTAGQNESFTVSGLSPETTYFFVIKTADEVPNWSALSNSANGTTIASPSPPPPPGESSPITGTSPGMMIGPGMVFPALGFNLSTEDGGTLVSIRVNILIPSGSPFAPATGLAPLAANDGMSGLALYKDNKSAGAFGQPDPPESFQDIYLPLASTPSWSQNGSTYETTLTLASPSVLPSSDTGNNAGQDYFLILRTSNMPPPGATFKVQIPADGITLDTATMPASAAPASPNAITVGQGGMMGSPVVISEIQTAGGTASDEFIELFNRTPDPVDLSSWSVQYKDGASANLSSSSPASKLNLSGTIPGNGFFLIANSSGYDYGGTKSADLAYTDANFALSSTGGTVFLVNNQSALTSPTAQAIQDKVGWGSGSIYAEGSPVSVPAANGSTERKAFPEATTTSMTSGIDVGMGNGFDSDNNLADFIVRTTSDPQNTTDAESPDMSGTNPVVINEVYYNNTASNHQGIELYNNAGDPNDVSGWKILTAGKTYTIPASTSISPGGYLVIHWNVDGTNDTGNLYTGTAGMASMSTLAGDVYLVDGGDGAKDYVEYGAGGQASEGTAGGAQWPTGNCVPGVLQGQSIGRGNNGYDTNKASDWQTFSSPTMGAMNAGGDSFAPDPVTGVTLVDSDNVNFGLNGQDVTVTWTPASSADETFDKYVIFILPATTELDTASHNPFAQVYGGQSLSSFTGSPAKVKDSAGNNLGDGSYKAYVMAVDWASNKSVAVASAAASLTAETSTQAGDDSSPPMIMSMPVNMSKEGADIIVLAGVNDNRALDSTTPTQLKWRVHGGGSFSAVDGTEVAPDTGFYRYTIPWNGSWNTSTQIDYYLVAKDAAGSYSYFTTNPGFDTAPTSHDAAAEGTAATSSFVVSIAPAASYNRTISGTVYDSGGAPLSQAGVMIPGSGLNVVVTGADGIYSFTVADGNYSVAARKAGYMEGWIDGISLNTGNTASAGNDFYLSVGNFGMGGDAGKPFVKWTDPGDGMMGAPIDIGLSAAPIVAHMSEPMDSPTVIDTNASDAGSNIFLTTTGQDRIPGQVTYNENDPNDPKIIFYSSTPLTKGTNYFFVIKSQVTDQAGNPIEGNQPDGRFVMQFTTFSDAAGGTFGQGIAFPPFVMGSMPAPGSFNVPINTRISITFSEAMDPSTIESGNGAGLNVRLYDPNYQNSGVGEYVTLASVALDKANNTVATLTIGGSLAASHHYEIRVLGGAKSNKGIYMADPGQPGFAALVVYRAEFDTGAGVDASGAPQIVGTNLEMYRASPTGDIGTPGTLVDVPVNLGVIEIGFNKDIAPATVNRDTITLKVGTTSIMGSVNYKSLDRVATFSPSTALNPNTTYTLRVTGGSSGIADMVGGAGHYLASDYYAIFTTSSQTDAEAPFITFTKASDFKAAISFSEPMNAARQTNTAQWPTSVLNPANYTFYTDTNPPDVDPTGTPYAGNSATDGNLGTAQGLSFRYDGDTTTVVIEGLQLSPVGGFRIWVNNATDLSSNTIDGNISAPDTSAFGRNGAGGPVGSSADGGMMGPGGTGMMGPSGSGMDMGQMGMMRAGAFPSSMIAGATTSYMVDVPLNRAITPGGSIVLTFPAGFDISGAKNADPNRQWAHKDINGPGPGIVILSSAAESTQSGGLNNDGVLVNTSARAVTIILGAVGTAGYQSANVTSDDKDFLHLEIAGIKNSNIPKSFETSGYTVDIKTMSGGSLLESLTSMPFFITEAGQYSISGTITFPNSVTTAAGEPIHIFGGSPAVGPIDIDVSFSNTATADYSIIGLPAGEYTVMTDAVVTISGGVGDGDYFGSAIPEPIWIDGATTVGGVYTKNFTFTTSSGKPGLTVNIVGDFSGEKAGEIDVFGGSPNGFSVKTISLNTNYPAGSPFSTTLYLPGNGSYMVGMGPAMPKGPMPMGPPPMPKWTPPPSVEVRYDGTNWVESSGTANDGTVLFTLGTSLVVPGHVYDGAGNPIPNAEVYAYSPMGMFGTHDSSLRDGSFNLYLPAGMYKVGAFSPGMPNSVEFGVDVRQVGGQTKIYVDGVEKSSLVIKIAKPERTISGKVTDGSKTITGASIFAYRTDGPGHAEAMTDSSGVYILYVSPGTWNVGGFLPGYGSLPEKTGIEVTTSDAGNINLFPEVGSTYVKISGTVTIGGVAQTNIPIRAVEVAANGSFTGNENGGSTDGNGNYSIKVKGTSSGEKHYRVDIWTPGYGELAANTGSGVTNTPTPAQPWNVAVATSDVSNVNINVGTSDLKTLTINFTGGSATMTAYVDVMRIDPSTTQPLGMGKHFEIRDLTQTMTVSLPAGAYHGFAHIPGYGEFIPTEGQSAPYYLDLTSDTTATFDLSGVGESAVTGTVFDGEGNPVADAFVHIGNPQTGMDFGTPTDSSGSYSLAVKAGTYMIGAEKPGYISEPTTFTVSAGANDQDVTITKTSLTITGHVYKDSNSNGSYDSGEGLSFAFVQGEKLGGGFSSTAADPDGSFTLYVSSGDWRLFGAAEGYQRKPYSGNPVTAESSSVSGVNILLSDTMSLTPPKAKPFKPASGATFDDPTAGLKITLPPNALGSGTSDYQVQGKETSSPSTRTAQPVGGKGKKVTVFDASGNPVTTLNDAINIEMTYTKADMVAAGFTGLEEIARIKMAYWDDSASAYVTIPTTISYDPAASTTWANLVSVTFKGTTTHLTVFSPILPADGLAPAAPTGLAATAGDSQVSLAWTTPTTNADSSALTDLHGYEVYRSTSATGTYAQVNSSDVLTNSYTDTSVTNGTTYYYKVTTADTGSNESVKSSASNAAAPAASSGTTPSTPASPGGGGSGGGLAGVTSVLGSITQAGRFTEDVTAQSENRKVDLIIPKDTIGKNKMGSLLTSISIKMQEEPPVAPSYSKFIGLVYDIGPSGATFDPPIDLTFKYDASLIPQGVAETNLSLATFDSGTSQWVELESTVDPANDTITAKVSHFSVFTALAHTRPAAFDIANLVIAPKEVKTGEKVTISVRITNTGDLEGSYKATLKMGNEVLASQEISLAGGASREVTFTATEAKAGTYAVDVDGLVGSFRVNATPMPATTPAPTPTPTSKPAPAPAPAPNPAAFSLSALTISPPEVEIGGEIKVRTVVTNTGGQPGNYEVILKVDGAVVDTARVTLDAGATQEVSFNVPGKAEAGIYTVEVNGKAGTFAVKESGTWWDNAIDTAGRWKDNAGDWWGRFAHDVSDWWDNMIQKMGKWRDRLTEK